MARLISGGSQAYTQGICVAVADRGIPQFIPKKLLTTPRVPISTERSHANRISRLLHDLESKRQKEKGKHTTGGIPRWSPTLVLVARFSAYVWQSGRDAQFSLTYGRMCLYFQNQ